MAEAAQSEPTAQPAAFVRALMGSLKATVQAAQRLPGEAEFEYQASLVKSKDALHSGTARLCALVERSAATWGAGLQLRPGSDPDDAFETLVDVTDAIFEDVDDCVDEIKGVNKYSAQQREREVVYHDPHVRKRRRSSNTRPAGETAAQSDSVREKPQKHFEDKVDNTHAPFVPKFKRAGQAGDPAQPAAAQPAGPAHPFAREIGALGYAPSQLQIAPGEERMYEALDKVPCAWVDTEAQLKALAGELEAPQVSRSGIPLRAVRKRLMPVCFVRFWRLRLIWRRTCIAASRGLCA